MRASPVREAGYRFSAPEETQKDIEVVDDGTHGALAGWGGVFTELHPGPMRGECLVAERGLSVSAWGACVRDPLDHSQTKTLGAGMR